MRRSALGVALVTAALAAGCGGGGGEITKQDYIAKADAICQEANDQLEALGQPQTLEEFATLAGGAADIGQQQLDDLRGLGFPAGDEETLGRAYELLEQQLESLKSVGEAAAAGDEARVTEIIAETESIDAEANQIAADYGLTVCGT